MSNTTVQLSTALAAARAAAAAIAHVGDPQAFEKAGAGPATVADLASQVAATRALQELCGAGTRFMAEESWDEVQKHGGRALLDPVVAALSAAGIPCSAADCERDLHLGADPGGDGSFWAIDPLDGTKGYLRGGQFAVAIALVVRGHPVLGVVAAPRLAAHGIAAGSGVIFGAVKGQGAWQTPLSGGPHTPIHCAAWKAGSPVRVAGSVESAHSDSSELEQLLASVGAVSSVRMDSQAKYGLVARGCADAYVRKSPNATYVEHVWDHAAGALIAQEAGCCVTDVHGLPLDYTRGRGLAANRGVVCAPHALHARLVQAFQTVMR